MFGRSSRMLESKAKTFTCPVGYIAGLAVAAQGQIMLAVIDTAVNTSALISLEQKAEILGIRA